MNDTNGSCFPVFVDDVQLSLDLLAQSMNRLCVDHPDDDISCAHPLRVHRTRRNIAAARKPENTPTEKALAIDRPDDFLQRNFAAGSRKAEPPP